LRRPPGGAAGTGVVAEPPVVVLDLNGLAEVWGVDHAGAAEGESDVVDAAAGPAEEQQVPGLQWLA